MSNTFESVHFPTLSSLHFPPLIFTDKNTFYLVCPTFFHFGLLNRGYHSLPLQLFLCFSLLVGGIMRFHTAFNLCLFLMNLAVLSITLNSPQHVNKRLPHRPSKGLTRQSSQFHTFTIFSF